MGNINVRVPDELEERFNRLAIETGRTKSFYIKKALEQISELEDLYLAKHRLENPTETITLDDFKKNMED